MSISINMFSKANYTKGHGVLSAFEEQVDLVKHDLIDDFHVSINKLTFADITHYHTINLGYFLTLPLFKFKSTTIGYVHFLPETVENSLQMPTLFKKVFYSYMIQFYKHMDHLVTVNPYFIDRLEAYGIPREKVTYIPNFVSNKMFFPLPKENTFTTRQKYNLPEDAFVVLCVGQLQTRKGIFDFIELANTLPHMQFVWAGDFSFGAMSDGYHDILKLRENPPANMHFLGLVDREDMNEIYNMSDTLLLPSYEELFPMTVLEAMNCNLPIILRDLDIYPNILFDYYLKGNSNEEFKDILLQLEQDTSYYQTACNNSWKGHLFYSRNHVASMWEDFYKKAIDYVDVYALS